MLFRQLAHAALISLTILGPACADVLAADGNAIEILRPWARATPGGATVGAAYVEIVGLPDTKGDKLVGVSSPAASRVEIHTHTMTDGVMGMRKIEFVSVAAGQTHKLAPGGDHLMLFDLVSPLKEGDELPLILKFEQSGDVTVKAVIGSVGAMGLPEKGAAAPAAAGKDAKMNHEGSDAGSHDGK